MKPRVVTCFWSRRPKLCTGHLVKILVSKFFGHVRACNGLILIFLASLWHTLNFLCPTKFPLPTCPQDCFWLQTPLESRGFRRPHTKKAELRASGDQTLNAVYSTVLIQVKRSDDDGVNFLNLVKPVRVLVYVVLGWRDGRRWNTLECKVAKTLIHEWQMEAK